MNNIALAFSGGGFRAAAFSLGTLSYLNNLKLNGQPEQKGPSLLSNVHFIGSTSGGSLANIVYSLGFHQNKSFNEIYRQLLAMLDGEKLITRVFEIFNDKKEWAKRPDKGRNLINAFAIAYDEHFGQATFGNLFHPGFGTNHNLEVCINATEFTNGLSFRFQSQCTAISNDKNGKIGNNYIYFTDPDVGGKLRLGDLMASSSCFSGGFEPIIFPDDFSYPGLERATLINNLHFKTNPFTINDTKTDLLHDETFPRENKRFGLMDGGVADNQAIDSIYKANNRRLEGDKFDLIILTDVTSYFVDGYTLPMEKKRWYNGFTLQQLINTLKFTSLCFLAMLVIGFWRGWSTWILLLIFPSGFTCACYLFGVIELANAKGSAKKTKSTWSLVFLAFISNFLRIRFSRVEQMLLSRMKSVLLLSEDIYLKTIRRIYYDKIYADPLYLEKLVSNAIYDLSKAKLNAQSDPIAVRQEAFYEQLSEPTPSAIDPPSGKVIAVAEQARLMATTLWFDEFQEKAETKRAIVATGQFTICYNLLNYINNKGIELPPEWGSIQGQLKIEWKKFNENPFWLYNEIP